MIKFACSLPVIGFLVTLGAPGAFAQTAPEFDVRDVAVGKSVSTIPDGSYADLSCVGNPEIKLPSWSAWKTCPAGADTLRAIRFEFDRETSREGTVVAGHPVLLTAYIDEKGVVVNLDIETDPRAKLYKKKKAFLFAAQVKSRYGSEGWTCTQGSALTNEEPVGGVFIREICRKTFADRTLSVERDLFRKSGADAKEFVDRTHVRIARRVW